MKKEKTDLLNLINIGPQSVKALSRVGINSISELKKVGAEKAYEKMCKFENKNIHRAFLYVMRAALWYEKNKDKKEIAKMWWMFRRTDEGRVGRNLQN
ncbi:MAG TPA: helix-hairpin-helix domain-containing protein [Candidatus Paceibacterota bacterium]|nr:helix-hairpin-helix domain-containing protein [Candidatus Paceibacterota bacterium]